MAEFKRYRAPLLLDVEADHEFTLAELVDLIDGYGVSQDRVEILEIEAYTDVDGNKTGGWWGAVEVDLLDEDVLTFIVGQNDITITTPGIDITTAER